MPLALVVSNAFDEAGGTAAGVLGVIAFFVSVGWALTFHRRLTAPSQTRNGALERLNQATTTAPFPAYMGIAVALITGAGIAIAPFVIVAAIAAAAAHRTGQALIAAQE